MANEARLRTNFISGTVTDNPLLIGATSLSSAGLASLATVDSTSHTLITLDPLGSAGAPEIVKVTAHTAAATTATIARAQDGTTARQHATGVAWSHGPVASDYDRKLYAARTFARSNLR